MDFHVSVADRFYLSSTSKGNQIKWFKNNMYLKADTMGYEGFAEALTSELLHFVVSDYDFIDYYLCNIIEDGKLYKGCYSSNYLKSSESFISIYRLLQKVDKKVDITLKKFKGKDLVDYVIDTVRLVSNIDCKDYFGYIVKFDAIILNEDRHLNNINLIYDNNYHVFRFAPIFDNGLSLLSDTTDYPLYTPINKCMESVKSKPFSTKFSKQVSYFDSDLLKIDFDGFLSSLNTNKDLFDCDEYKRAKDVILYRLEKMEGILWQRV